MVLIMKFISILALCISGWALNHWAYRENVNSWLFRDKYKTRLVMLLLSFVPYLVVIYAASLDLKDEIVDAINDVRERIKK